MPFDGKRSQNFTLGDSISFTKAAWYSTRFTQPLRLIHQTTAMSGAHDAEFKSAQERVLQLKEAPDNQIKLKLYALFKQVS